MMTQTLLMTMILQFRMIQSTMDSISTFLLLHRRLLLFRLLHLHWTFSIFFIELPVMIPVMIFYIFFLDYLDYLGYLDYLDHLDHLDYLDRHNQIT
jgi:hypothetical protein